MTLNSPYPFEWSQPYLPYVSWTDPDTGERMEAPSTYALTLRFAVQIPTTVPWNASLDERERYLEECRDRLEAHAASLIRRTLEEGR